MLFKIYTRNELRNMSTWSWGLLFMLFWLFMGAYVFESGPVAAGQSLYIVASFFSLFGLVSYSSIAISFAQVTMYSSQALPYAFRYTRLTPGRYILDFIASFLVMSVIFSSLLLAFSYVIFSLRFGTSVPPADPLLTILISALAGVFLASMDQVLVIFTINHLGLKSMAFVSFIPLLLTYALGFPFLFVSIPQFINYISPFNGFIALLYSSYSGAAAHSTLSNVASPVINEYLSATSVIAWVIVLTTLSALMVRNIRPRNLEEQRQI